ncbi:MAG: hypothetical protein KIT13_05265 [Burkholderiales bacterium]|nr:hypothetical protein [Burkholderiales bacterium]
MVKYLLVAIVAALAIGLLRSRWRRPDREPRQAPPPEDMVGCAHCGIHFPHGEGVAAGGHRFCSEAHRDQFRSSR